MKKNLTERQNEILNFIQQFRDETGYPPTLREIGKKFGISSTFGVKRHLDALVKKGCLSVESNASRGIAVLDSASGLRKKDEESTLFSKIPVIGRVAAGTPVTAIENVEGSIVVDSAFIKRAEECYALKVKGDSMINAGIFEGDYVIVSSGPEAYHNEIVVALLEDEATVKRLYKKEKSVMLIPENEKYHPIDLTNRENCSIIGKVIGVVRWFN
ncbi:MAG TPA: transcriptional repressor LexA [Ignavibacteriaceae bacterium]|jgi:repressor LexA|nr:transcriptional repressor LexA [Ignavibacteriaceae bacterium]